MCELTPDQYATFSDSLLSPAHARAFVREHSCPEHGTAALGALALVASELVTNSVLHGRPPILVQLRCRVHEIDLSVADTGPGLPGDRGTSGSLGVGLLVVAEIANDWGVTPGAIGKEVWCRLPTGVLPRSALWRRSRSSAPDG